MNDTSPPSPPAKPVKAKGASLFAKILALPLALLLLLAIPLAILSFDIWRVVFNLPLIKAFITDEVVNSDLIPAGLAWFSEERAKERVKSGEALSGVDEPDVVLLLSFLSADDWRAIKKEILPDEFLTHLVSVTVDGAYTWIDSADRVPQITWDLKPFKAGVAGQPGENAVTIAYLALPACTEEQIADFLARLAASPAGVEVLYNLCEFPDPWHDDQIQDYVNALVDVNQNIPDQFALTETLSQMPDRDGVGPETIKEQLRLIRLLGMLAWALPLLLLVLIAALVVRSLRTLSGWLAVPLFIGGLLTLLIVIALNVTVATYLSSGVLSETPELLRQEVIRVVTRLAGEIFNPMLIQAGVILVISVLIVLANWIGGLFNKKKPAPPPAPGPEG